ncbi:ribulose-phosphate 3-epimerase [Eggerthellaceae bacterium 3-80]|nr:ribulose-phosphate 3-epimerase [bacterium D16-34]
MFEPVKIAPSILSADFMNLARDIERIDKGGAGFIHVDVMDGHFVNNLTMGVPIVKQLKRVTNVPLDVHLMIDNPQKQLPWYLDAGADYVTVHAEVLDENQLCEIIDQIHQAGAKAGVSVKPSTSLEVLKPVVDRVDMVLIMSVEPGFSGQSYIEGSDERVAEVVLMAREKGVSPLIEVDGGMNVDTVGKVCAQGADVIVCGNAVCAASDPAAALQEIERIANAAQA